MSLGVYIARRLLQMIPVLLGVVFLVFSLLHLVPGDPAMIMAGEQASPVQLERMRERRGFGSITFHQKIIATAKNETCWRSWTRSLRSARSYTPGQRCQNHWLAAKRAIATTGIVRKPHTARVTGERSTGATTPRRKPRGSPLRIGVVGAPR